MSNQNKELGGFRDPALTIPACCGASICMREVVPIGHVQHEPVTVFQVVCGAPRVRNRAGEPGRDVLAPVAHHEEDLTSGGRNGVRKPRIPEIRFRNRLLLVLEVQSLGIVDEPQELVVLGPAKYWNPQIA